MWIIKCAKGAWIESRDKCQLIHIAGCTVKALASLDGKLRYKKADASQEMKHLQVHLRWRILPENAFTRRQQPGTVWLVSEFKVISQLNEFLQLSETAQIN